MLDLNEVNWINDCITRRYVREHADKLQEPEKMGTRELGDAVTYCQTFFNPYAEELMRRAGNLEAFYAAAETKEQRIILNNAAKSFGFRFCG